MAVKYCVYPSNEGDTKFKYLPEEEEVGSNMELYEVAFQLRRVADVLEKLEKTLRR